MKNLVKVVALAGDDHEILKDLYDDLGEYLGLSGSGDCDGREVIGLSFRYSSDAKELLNDKGFKEYGDNYLKGNIRVTIEYGMREYMIKEV